MTDLGGGGGGKRLNKRQLRELQELEALEQQKDSAAQQASEQLEESEEETTSIPAAKGGASLFAQLVDGQHSESEDEAGQQQDITSTTTKSKNKNKKKKKKKNAAAAVTASAEAAAAEEVFDDENARQAPQSTAPANAQSKSSKRRNKKPANRTSETATPSKDVSQMSMDEFSALLATQAQVDQEKQQAGAAEDVTITPIGPLSSLRSHLALSAPALDPAVELKRQFGAAAIKAYESEASQGNSHGSSGAASAGARARAQAWNTNFKVRNILVQPKDTWPPIARTFTGMTMNVLDVPGRGRIGGWEHSRAYRRAQYEFLQAVQSYEPNHLMGLLRMYPWHIDTLLQLSDVSRHQGDLGQASDFNARALFAFERTAAPIFTSSLTSHLGPPMLNFDRIEDRGFWLAAHRNVNFLGRRGTWRTALEWVKLILGLDPTNDHHGMLLWLDFLSIKSRQHAWFLQCLQKLESAVALDLEDSSVPILNAKTPFDEEKANAKVGEGAGCRGALDWYAGLSYAKALALRTIEKEEALNSSDAAQAQSAPSPSTSALRLAIARHPQIIPALLDKIGVPMPTNVPSSHALFQHGADDGDTMGEILTHIYVARSESLWREPGVSKWLTKSLQDAWPASQAAYDAGSWSRATATSDKARMSIYRHVLVSDLPDALRQTLVGLMPKAITQNSAMLNAFDPLPPQGAGTTSYDDEYFSLMRSRRGAGDEDDFGVDLDGPAAAGLMDRLMQALRGVRGMEGWNAAMQDMDDETRQDVMAQMMEMAAQAHQAADGGEVMPGALVGMDGGEDADADQAAETEAEQGRSFGALRGLLDRMWGGNGAQQQQDPRTGTDNDDDDNDYESGSEDVERLD